jgi:hypothetical protein
VFIFSEEQFAHFQSVLPNMQEHTGRGAVAWANANGVTYEAAGYESKNTPISYNVTETGNYVAVITNAGAAYAFIQDFNVNLISYNQTQDDGLYLYIGIVLMIIGIIFSVMIFRHRKTQ